MSYNRLDIQEYNIKTSSIINNLEDMSDIFDATTVARSKYQSLISSYFSKGESIDRTEAESIFVPTIRSDSGIVANGWLSPLFTSTSVDFSSDSELIDESIQDELAITAITVKGQLPLKTSSEVSAVRLLVIGEAFLRGIYSEQGRIAGPQMVSGDTTIWVIEGAYSTITLDFEDAFIHTIQLLKTSMSNTSPQFDIIVPLANVESFKILGKWNFYIEPIGKTLLGASSLDPSTNLVINQESKLKASIITEYDTRKLVIRNRFDGTFWSRQVAINPLALTNMSNPIRTLNDNIIVRLTVSNDSQEDKGLILSDIKVDFNPR